MSQEEYAKALEEFRKLLVTPKTAKQLALLANCTKQSVYARIEDLQKRGYIIVARKLRASKTGPLSWHYRLATPEEITAMLAGEDPFRIEPPKMKEPKRYGVYQVMGL
jgi:predicted transcriptional regulator